MKTWAGVVFAVLGIAAIISVVVRLRHEPPAGANGPQIPALLATEDEFLEVGVETERLPGARRLRLRLGGGEALLTLDDVRPDERGMGFGKAKLKSMDDRALGGRFVVAVARWLGVPPPPPRIPPGELRDFPCSYVRLGSDEAWEANKLFLETGQRYAEVFLNLSVDGRRARLLEKDEEYREVLTGILASVLRDGPPPRRSPANDPNVASADALASAVQPVVEGEGVGAGTWGEAGFLGAVTRDGRTRLLLWAELSKRPREVATVEGRVVLAIPAPRGDRVALSVVYPSAKSGYSSDDPSTIVVVDVAGGSVTSLADPEPGLGRFAIWSPNGAALAIAKHSPGQPRQTETRVIDTSSRRVLAASAAALNASPHLWDEHGLVLRAWHFALDPADTRVVDYLWRPGVDTPSPAPSQTQERSPDGRFGIHVYDDAIEIVSEGGSRRVTFAVEDRDALVSLREGSVRWIGSHLLIVEFDETMALDIETGKLHFLFPSESLRFDGASPDGRTVLARDEDDGLAWATLP